MIKDIPFHPDPTFRSPSKPVRIPMSEKSGNIDISPECNINFKENSQFQEGVIWETFQRPYKSFFQKPQALKGLVNTGKKVQKSLPKLADINKILKVIQRKVFKGTHLSV